MMVVAMGQEVDLIFDLPCESECEHAHGSRGKAGKMVLVEGSIFDLFDLLFSNRHQSPV